MAPPFPTQLALGITIAVQNRLKSFTTRYVELQFRVTHRGGSPSSDNAGSSSRGILALGREDNSLDLGSGQIQRLGELQRSHPEIFYTENQPYAK